MDIWFEHMGVEHGKEVMEIFNYYVENSSATYPDTVLPYPFYGRFLEMARNYPAYVIRKKDSDAVIGFCLLHAYNPFPVFRHTAEITCFISKDEVGKGTGTRALSVLEQDAKKMGINILLASINSQNTASIRFHEKNGFKECGRFFGIGEKKGRSFDQVWMQKNI
ncbi:MAG: N-acetyltransferase family protein [Syntrophomonadaceae bacterium]